MPRRSATRTPRITESATSNGRWPRATGCSFRADTPRHISTGRAAIRPAASRSETHRQWYQFAQKTDTALNINPDCAYSFGCTSGDWCRRTAPRPRAGFTCSPRPTHRIAQLKVGVQHAGGPSDNYNERNADLQQNYSTGGPQRSRCTTRRLSHAGRVNHDLGIYAQDSWTIKRLTVSPGLRVE